MSMRTEGRLENGNRLDAFRKQAVSAPGETAVRFGIGLKNHDALEDIDGTLELCVHDLADLGLFLFVKFSALRARPFELQLTPIFR